MWRARGEGVLDGVCRVVGCVVILTDGFFLNILMEIDLMEGASWGLFVGVVCLLKRLRLRWVVRHSSCLTMFEFTCDEHLGNLGERTGRFF